MKSDKTMHLLKMVLLILLVVIAAFGVIFELIMLFVKPIELLHVGILIASLGLVFISYKGILFVLSSWKVKTIKKVVELEEGLIAKWEINIENWKIYLEEQKVKDKQDLKSYAIMTFTIGLLVGFIMFIFSFSWQMSTVYALGMTVGLSLVITSLIRWSQKNQHTKLETSASGKIYFADEVIIMNQVVISFQQLGQSISKVTIDKDRSVPVLNVDIETRTTNGKTNKEYSIPINENQIEEVKKVITFCEEQIG